MINRNNYEEYLLMYLDGELSPEQQAAVEAFLLVNPDLEAEFRLLQQTILPAEDNISFPGKESLYRDGGIHAGNYQEYFLLYIDGELNEADKEAVETFVLQNPSLQEEFTLLKGTVLPAEQLIFRDKQSLYRREKKLRPVVISIRWASLAAAAVLAIVALLVFNKGSEPDPVAGTTPAIKVQQPAPGVEKQEVLPELPANNNTTIAEAPVKTAKQVAPVQVKQQMVESPVIAYEQKEQEQRSLAVVETPPVVGNPVTGNTGSETTTTLEAGETKASFTRSDNTDNEKSNLVQPAVYTEELDTEKDKNLYVGAMQINPDKVRGLFRKAGRFLSNKVKNSDEEGDDGKLRIANMEVNKIK